MSACGLPGDCPNIVKVRLSDGSDGSIGQACYPSDKELSDGEKNDVMTNHDKQGLIHLGIPSCALPGDCPNLMKVRLFDWSDESIG